MNFQKSFLMLVISLCSITFTSAKTSSNWQPHFLFGESFFPSFAVATSTYKNILEGLILNSEKNSQDPRGQIGVEVIPYQKSYTLKVKISCDEIMFPTEASITVNPKNKKFIFHPKLDYKWTELKKAQQTRPITIKITTWINGKLQDTKMSTLTLQSINNCPYTCISKENEIIDLNYMYAAYVNEDHPIINNVLLKEMLSQGAINQISAYQTKNPADVYAQVFAVWNMLQKRGIKYSSLYAAGNRDQSFLPIVYHQYVRTVDDALTGEQANCVDGTVLMASILYRMGINPLIITTPYHCFLAYELGNGTISFLETTMLGSEISAENSAAVKTYDIYNPTLGAKFGKVYDNFIAATLTGKITYDKDADKFNNYSTFVRLSIVTNENRSDLVNRLQYQKYPVAQYKDRGLQSIYK